ncbi:MAG: hypothetical protein JRI46_05130 [Deltaproteobacteria bacterium]|nr:hypothetical protein [Deltaproteobacteria bacterium]
MSKYCRICGRPMKKEGDICEACQESIRAEAMGRQRRVAKEAQKELDRLSVQQRKGAKTKEDLFVPKEEEEEKRPHHFKSMAEYLEYLKEKGR